MIPGGSWGFFFFLEKFKEEVIFQMSPKGEKVSKVEKDVIGIPGMAELRQVKTHGCLEEPQGAGLCVQEAEMGVVGASSAWIPCCGLEACGIGYFTALCSCIGTVGPVGCRWVGIGGSGLTVCRVEGKKGAVV